MTATFRIVLTIVLVVAVLGVITSAYVVQAQEEKPISVFCYKSKTDLQCFSTLKECTTALETDTTAKGDCFEKKHVPKPKEPEQ